MLPWRPELGLRQPTGAPGAPCSECVDLRLVSQPTILVVHCRPDAVADQPADSRSGDGSGDPVAGSAANGRSDQRA